MTRALAVLLLFTTGCCASMSDLVDPRLVVQPTVAASAYTPPPARDDVATSVELLHDAARNRDVPIRIYMPAHATTRVPLVVFSHGIGEDRDSYAWLGRALAAHGYASVHVTHAGTDRAMLETGYWNLYKATKDKQNWVNRPLDVRFVLDELLKRPQFDATRIAVIGHSAGAFTALAIAGMLPTSNASLGDPRPKAAIAMSMPKMTGVVGPGGYDHLTMPVMHMTGTCDASLIYRTNAHDRRTPFVESHSPNQLLVTFEGLKHESFSNKEDKWQPTIAAMVVAYLDGVLNGNAAAMAWVEGARREGVVVEKK